MANITIDADNFSVVRHDLLGAYECHLTANVDDRRGKLFYVVPATGRASLADADGSGTLSPIMGIAVDKEKTNLPGESVTLMRKGELFLGTDALDALDIGDPLYASDDAGMIADTASATNSVQIGYVIAVEVDKTLQKLAFIDTMHLAIPVIHPEEA